MKRTIYSAVFGLLSLTAANAMAATIVQYAFDSGTATLLNPGVSVSDPSISNISAWTDRDGALIANGLVGNPNTGRAIGATSFGTGAVAGNEFRFSFDVNGTLSLNSFSFWEQGSAGGNGLGPSAWTLFINDLQVASGPTQLGQPGGSRSGSLVAFSQLQNLTGTVNFRLFASGAANDTDATWRVDNFTLEGTVQPVPLPPAMWLLGSALLPLLMNRRRRI
jgi:hypothetical protein